MRLEAREPRPHDHQHAEEAQHDAAGAALGHALAEDQRRQQRHPGRRREFEREHGGERQQRHRKRPAELPDEMRGVAREMEADVARRKLAPQRRLQRDQHEQHEQPRARADRQDFEHVELLAERADGERADRERQQCAGHPENDPAELRSGHAGFFGFAGKGPPCISPPPRRHSASGWFSGRALSKAGSFSSAASAATSFGNASSGTFKPPRVVHLRHEVDVGERDVARRSNRGRAGSWFRAR